MSIKVDFDNVIYRKLDDFIYIYCIKQGNIFTLEDVSMDIVEYIYEKSNETSIEKISEYIASIYDAEISEIIIDVQEIVDELKLLGFLYNNNNFIQKIESDKDCDDIEGSIIDRFHENNSIYSATFEMTYSCNERCIHCYALDCEYEANNGSLSIDEWKKIIDELRAMNCVVINFTGGDPFVYKDFYKIFKYARESNFLCNIYTNGQILHDFKDIMNNIISLNPRTIYMSLYGSNADMHDNITGIKGSFYKTINVSKIFVERGINVVFQIMIMKNNYSQYNEIIALSKSIGVEYRVGISIINTNNGSSHPQNYMLRNYEAIKEIFTKYRDDISFMDGDKIISNKDENANICGAGETAISISPDGIVYPCVSLKYYLGNIKDNTIMEIWNGINRQILIKRLSCKNMESCYKCDMLQYCPHCVGISHAESGNMLACNECDKLLAKVLMDIENEKGR